MAPGLVRSAMLAPAASEQPPPPPCLSRGHPQGALSLPVSPETEGTAKKVLLHKGGEGHRWDAKSRPLLSRFLCRSRAQKAAARGTEGCMRSVFLAGDGGPGLMAGTAGEKWTGRTAVT